MLFFLLDISLCYSVLLDAGYNLFYFYFMSMGILPACISVHHRLAWCLPEAGVASPGTGLTDDHPMGAGR